MFKVPHFERVEESMAEFFFAEGLNHFKNYDNRHKKVSNESGQIVNQKNI